MTLSSDKRGRHFRSKNQTSDFTREFPLPRWRRDDNRDNRCEKSGSKSNSQALLARLHRRTPAVSLRRFFRSFRSCTFYPNVRATISLACLFNGDRSSPFHRATLGGSPEKKRATGRRTAPDSIMRTETGISCAPSLLPSRPPRAQLLRLPLARAT